MNNESLFRPILSFFILLIISEIIRRFYRRNDSISTSVGSIIMAIGIFALFALQELPFSNILVSQLVTLELLILWIYIVIYIFLTIIKMGFSVLIHDLHDKLGIGTWVAGTAVLGMLILKDFPSFYIISLILALLAFAIWIAYLWMILHELQILLFKHSKVHTGIILLTTVSTQSIVLLINSLFTNRVSIFVNDALIMLGYLFYCIGLMIILKYLLSIKLKRLVLSWDNTNSIIHGALSISGLASLVAGSVKDDFIIFIWLSATILFILVEGISLIKLYYRIQIAGIMKGVCLYNISQWSRNFTYGMYYAFTLSISDHHLTSNLTMNTISIYGQYIVFLMLLIEIIIFFRNKFFYLNRYSC